jgi:transcription elongation factor Elf1
MITDKRRRKIKMKILDKEVFVIINMECPQCQKKFVINTTQIDEFVKKNGKCDCGHVFDFSVLFSLVKEIAKDDLIGYLNSVLKGRLINFSPF